VPLPFPHRVPQVPRTLSGHSQFSRRKYDFVFAAV
jgi:hypothetical protein